MFVRLILFAALIASCAHSVIVPFQMTGAPSAPVPPETVGVYRSIKPFDSFTELGLISYKASQFDLAGMYDQLRQDSALVGAEAVVDVKISGETHVEYNMENKCIPHTTLTSDGTPITVDECHMEQVPKDVSTFLISGSMIKRRP